MPSLFEPLTIRGVTLRNRIGVSPMCQYSAEDGFMNQWHLVHLGSRAVGGAGLVMTEASAVQARGRISPQDAGIYRDEHIEPLALITKFIKEQGAVPGIQLAHAGRKASTHRPWDGAERTEITESEGGWVPFAPSAVAFDSSYPQPLAMTKNDIEGVQKAFVGAAERAQKAGFEVVELHFAHGYLAHEFLSPLSNQRDDEYGGSFENRIRFAVETAQAVREAWPQELPLLARLSCTDWVEGGWTIDESVDLAKRLKAVGVDLIDCSSGGSSPTAQIPVGAGYQVPFSERIKHDAGVATAAVGMITDPAQADDYIRNQRADMVFLAREMLRDPYWPLHAAQALHVKTPKPVPVQYGRAFG